MKIGILLLTKSKFIDTNAALRLSEVAVARGHKVETILETDLLFVEKDGAVEVSRLDQPLGAFDVIIVRSSYTEDPGLHTSTTEFLRRAGYKLVGGLAMHSFSKNKLTERVALLEAGIAMPRWAIARSSEQAERGANMIGFPLIVKLAFGTHGKGVFYAENLETFLPIADYLAVRDRNPMIIEEFIQEAGRKDLRVFVVGGEIVAAMERQAKADDVRANASIGGTGNPVELTEQEKETAINAAAAFHLEIAGVDILRSKRGPLVIEVNANPGFEELERATGIDVAGAIMDYVER